MTEIMDVEELRAAMFGICKRHPRKKNPTGREGAGVSECLYTDTKNKNRHCIAGTLAAEQGWSIPKREGLSASAVATRLSWPLTMDAAFELDDWQVAADSGNRVWGEVAKVMGGDD